MELNRKNAVKLQKLLDESLPALIHLAVAAQYFLDNSNAELRYRIAVERWDGNMQDAQRGIDKLYHVLCSPD